MEEVKEIEVKETKSKRKTTGRKKTEPKVEPKVEDAVDYKTLFEQMQEQMKLMQEQMKMMEVKKEEKKKGTTIFYSTHVLSEVSKICDRVGIIKNGKLIKIENIDELIEMDLEDIEDIIGRLSNNHKINLRDEVAKKIKNEEIRDYVVVQALKRILNIEFV